VAKDYAIPERHRENTPAGLQRIFARVQAAGAASVPAVNYFPDYPFGSDFTSGELMLLAALKRLKRESASLPGLLRLAVACIRSSPSRPGIQQCLRRMGLASASGFRQKLQRRLLAATLPRDAQVTD
jgi:hypothetical protein